MPLKANKSTRRCTGVLPTVRPTAYRFFANILTKIGGTIEAVHIDLLKDITYYATVKVGNGKQTYEVDARPSDAIALALQTNSAIFVSEALMAQAGSDLPQPFEGRDVGDRRAGWLRLA